MENSTPQSYEELLGQLLIVRATNDSCQWAMGDGAAIALGENLVMKGKQGEVNLTKLANDLGVGVRSMQDWYKVATFYPEPARHVFENLSYTHYRMARRYAGDVEQAMELLEHACVEGLSVAKFEHHLKEVVGKPQPKPDDSVKVPRLLLTRAVGLIETLEPELAQLLREYLQ